MTLLTPLSRHTSQQVVLRAELCSLLILRQLVFDRAAGVKWSDSRKDRQVERCRRPGPRDPARIPGPGHPAGAGRKPGAGREAGVDRGCELMQRPQPLPSPQVHFSAWTEPGRAQVPPRGPTGARTGLGGPWRDSAPLASRAPCAPRGSLSLPSWSRPSRLPGQGLDSEAWSLPAASAGPAGSASSPLGPPPAPPPEWPRESLRAGQTAGGAAQGQDSPGTAPRAAGKGERRVVPLLPPFPPPGATWRTYPTNDCAGIGAAPGALRQGRSSLGFAAKRHAEHRGLPDLGHPCTPQASIQGLSEAKARACSAATQGATFHSLWTSHARGLWTWLVGPLPEEDSLDPVLPKASWSAKNSSPLDFKLSHRTHFGHWDVARWDSWTSGIPGREDNAVEPPFQRSTPLLTQSVTL
ncbi:collagen alpha-1(I) chain-like [Canis lupus dingo]|uniref:collagen alpha-1(I) chain-like n=1 Tax=Canis lupus dingo TaxID=286419 RepID=UPI0020C59068|nr:collagen alpha-1(I) chain-like [Canis lupus dingo]